VQGRPCLGLVDRGAGAAYPGGMEYHCSRCHARFSASADAAQSEHGSNAVHCPKCKAEAGLEPVKRAPLPMILFAVFLGTAVLATAVSGLLSLASSSG
jgi:DNA-directed RNA polymerase subunit RPC12/RpoP